MNPEFRRLGLLAVSAICLLLSPPQLMDADAKASASSARGVASLERVARSVAMALSDPAVRVSVRDAMRASPWVSHKLELQSFLMSPKGQVLRRAMLGTSGLKSQELGRLLAQLPPLDFYMLMREHRLTWDASASPGVFATLGGKTRPVGYRADGSRFTEVDASAPFFALHPAEPKGRRVGAQPLDRPGTVIQDPDDGEISERYVWQSDLSGETLMVDMADKDAKARLQGLLARIAQDVRGHVKFCLPEDVGCCTPEAPECGGSGGGTTPPPPTRLIWHQMWFCDDNYGPSFCFEDDLEVRYTTEYFSPGGTRLSVLNYTRGGMKFGEGYQQNATLLSARIVPGSGQYLRIWLVEEDQNDPFGVNNDDNCGYVIYNESQNGQVRDFPRVPDCTSWPWFTETLPYPYSAKMQAVW